MKLYLIKQDDNCGYDTYDSAVVIATSEEEARQIHPSTYYKSIDGVWHERHEINGKEEFRPASEDLEWGPYGEWTTPENVTVTCIGAATQGKVGDVVCASFNAG